MSAHRWKTDAVGALDTCTRCGAQRGTPLWPMGVDDLESQCAEPERRVVNRRAHDNASAVSEYLSRPESSSHPCPCDYCSIKRADQIIKRTERTNPQAGSALESLLSAGERATVGAIAVRRAWVTGYMQGIATVLAALATVCIGLMALMHSGYW